MSKGEHTYSHTCIKPGCGTAYKSGDVDAYYCPPCLKGREALAKEVDAKVNARVRKHTPSTIQLLESGQQVPGPHGSKLFSRKIYGN